jgi:hypothetical protein
MASGAPDSSAKGQVLVCPACQAKCRVRVSAASAVRCPTCGARIDLTRVADEPRREPTKRPVSQRARAAEEGEPSYEALAPEARSRVVAAPEPDLRALPPEEPPPPRFPLWGGIYTFPWHATTLRPWLMFGIGFTIVALLGAASHQVIILYEEAPITAQGIYFRVVVLFLKALGLFILWTCTFAGPYFLATVRDTAAGNDAIAAPDESVPEKFFLFAYLVWLGFCAAVPAGLLGVAARHFAGIPALGWAALPIWLIVFPFVLFGSFVNNSLLMLWSTPFVVSLLQRPLVVAVLYLTSAALVITCLALGFYVIGEMQYFLAPVTGFVWSACLLIYARLLGRVGYIVSGPEVTFNRPRRKKRRKSKADDEE